jgi:hypothetical protein
MNPTIASPEPGRSPIPPAAPPVSYRWPVVATIVGLGLWAVLTVGAPWVLPPLLGVIDQVEVALGLDVALRPPPSAKP